ncbi:hypothetical protein D3C71_77030 [compost metagenome]
MARTVTIHAAQRSASYSVVTAGLSTPKKSTKSRNNVTAPKIVSVLIEATAGTGKTALGTVIEKTLRDAGVDVVRQPVEEIDGLGFPESLAVLGEMTSRNIQVALSERHVSKSGFETSYDKLFTVDHPLPGYFKLWHNGRVVLECEPQEHQGHDVWKPTFLDRAYSLKRVRFALSLYDHGPAGRIVGNFPSGKFTDVVSAARDYVLVWMQQHQLNPMNAAFTRDQATLLRRRSNELLDKVMGDYITDTSAEGSLYPDCIRVDMPQDLVEKRAELYGSKKTTITVEAPTTEAKVALVLLISQMLNDSGLPPEDARSTFNAPATMVLDFDHPRCLEILRELAKTTRIDVVC